MNIPLFLDVSLLILINIMYFESLCFDFEHDFHANKFHSNKENLFISSMTYLTYNFKNSLLNQIFNCIYDSNIIYIYKEIRKFYVSTVALDEKE